jgi:hypothetical protein
MARQIKQDSTYADRLLKLVPAEWVSGYIAIKGILDSNQDVDSTIYFTVIAIQLIILPFYLIYALRIKNTSQIWLTSISFLVWVFSVGGQQFGSLEWYYPYHGTIVLILWTSAIPMWNCGSNSGSGRVGVPGTNQPNKKH